LIERNPGLKEFQTEVAETEKARDVKTEVTANLSSWWVEDELSCLAD